MTARAWVALWTVYILWGSTYLGIELAGETIPPLFAAGIRFTTVGVVLTGWLLARRGDGAVQAGLDAGRVDGALRAAPDRRERAAVRRRAPRADRARLADLRVGAALARRPPLEHRRPPAARLARRDGGRVRRRRAAPAAGRRRQRAGVLLVVAAALSWAIGTFLSSRLPMPGDALTTAGVQGLDGRAAAAPARHGARRTASRSTRPTGRPARCSGSLYLVVFGSIFGYTAYVWLRRERAARHRRHLRVREPARRDHARRPLPRRGGDVADRRRRRGDPDLGRRRDPARGAAAAGRGDPAARESRAGDG